jgi:hypothetical protein
MRNILRSNSLLFISLAGVMATACAGRAHTNNPMANKTLMYACDGNRTIAKSAVGVRTSNSDAPLTAGWHDDNGSHYIAWPTAATTMETVDYFIPDDDRSDAMERVYDTSGGTSRADWKLLRSSVCTANGGYSDALARFAGGKSFDQVAKELDVKKSDARELVHQALVSLNKRYYGNH